MLLPSLLNWNSLFSLRHARHIGHIQRAIGAQSPRAYFMKMLFKVGSHTSPVSRSFRGKMPCTHKVVGNKKKSSDMNFSFTSKMGAVFLLQLHLTIVQSHLRPRGVKLQFRMIINGISCAISGLPNAKSQNISFQSYVAMKEELPFSAQ